MKVETVRRPQRRGAIVVWTAVSMTTLLGFAAISIDVGYLYMVKGEMQSAADSAALAAAAELASFDNARLTRAKEMAAEFSAKNEVLNAPVEIDPDSDVIFGMATLNNETGQYGFDPDGAVIDAVRVRVRRTSDSPSGSIPLFFANIFGKSQKDMWAEATAILIPRDIAVVADLSGSHNDDSELRHVNETDVNLYDVWDALPMPKGNNGVGNGLDPPPPGNPAVNDGEGTEPGNPGNQGGNDNPGANPTKGPTWGNMNGFGSFVRVGAKRVLDSTYDPTTDEGLIHLPRYQNWSNSDIEDYLRGRDYNDDEVAAIMSSGNDSDSSAWRARAMVALGIMRWRSGMGPDDNGKLGKWESEELDPGNGNTWVGWNTEMETMVEYPYPGGSWKEYTDYMKGWSQMTSQGNSAFQYRFGVKTFINYLLEEERCYDECPDFYLTPTQPMQAVKDSVTRMTEVIEELQTDDKISLEIYGETTNHEVDLTYDYSTVSARLTEMQAGHYDIWTNMGGGIQLGIDELTGERARSTATKVMVLLTDGKANVTANGTTGDYYNGPLYAIEKAAAAAALGIRIYTVSVGAAADTDTMEQIAEIGNGTHFYATGSIEEYTEQLEAIFQALGGKRAVMLIN